MASSMLHKAEGIGDELVRLRRAIHRHPELGFQEVKTAALVAETLESLGIRVKRGIGKTGVVGYLGEGPPTIGLRADMDALPIEELNEVSYASEVAGVMHACGHDAHVAMLLGVAMLLSREDLPGQVRFLFQPSEEAPDEEGKSGAARLVEEGAMEGVDGLLGLHVDAEAPTGTIRVSPGPSLAAADRFEAIIKGKGTHGAMPHRGVDPIFIAGQVIGAVQAIAAQRIDPIEEVVVTIGAIHGGMAPNVIPHQVELRGTIRTFGPRVRRRVHRELRAALRVAKALGGDFTLKIDSVYPVTVNDERMTELVRQVAIDLLGGGKVRPKEKVMGSEDFSLLAAKAPGAMFRLGVRKGKIRPNHSPHFDIDERALPVGTAVMAEAARRYLMRRY